MVRIVTFFLDNRDLKILSSYYVDIRDVKTLCFSFLFFALKLPLLKNYQGCLDYFLKLDQELSVKL
jgi:hypothetical protein